MATDHSGQHESVHDQPPVGRTPARRPRPRQRWAGVDWSESPSGDSDSSDAPPAASPKTTPPPPSSGRLVPVAAPVAGLVDPPPAEPARSPATTQPERGFESSASLPNEDATAETNWLSQARGPILVLLTGSVLFLGVVVAIVIYSWSSGGRDTVAARKTPDDKNKKSPSAAVKKNQPAKAPKGATAGGPGPGGRAPASGNPNETHVPPAAGDDLELVEYDPITGTIHDPVTRDLIDPTTGSVVASWDSPLGEPTAGADPGPAVAANPQGGNPMPPAGNSGGGDPSPGGNPATTPQPPADPFRELAAKIDLPPVGKPESSPSSPVVLGAIHLPDGEPLKLALRDSDPSAAVKLAPRSTTADGRAWRVEAVEDDQTRPVANLAVTAGRLQFAWAHGVAARDARRLRFAMLELEAAGHTETRPLYSERSAPPLSIELLTKGSVVTIDSLPIPEATSLQLKVTGFSSHCPAATYEPESTVGSRPSSPTP